jgi:hypothetical protein
MKDKIKTEETGLTLWSLILPTNILVRAYASWSVFTFSPTYSTHKGMKGRIGWLRIFLPHLQHTQGNESQNRLVKNFSPPSTHRGMKARIGRLRIGGNGAENVVLFQYCVSEGPPHL